MDKFTKVPITVWVFDLFWGWGGLQFQTPSPSTSPFNLIGGERGKSSAAKAVWDAGGGSREKTCHVGPFHYYTQFL